MPERSATPAPALLASLEQLEDSLVAVEASNDGLGVGNSLFHNTHDEIFSLPW